MSTPIIIGQDYTKWNVVEAVKNFPTFPVLSKKLPDIARELQAHPKFVEHVRDRMLLENYRHTDVFFEVLEEWVERKSNEASLKSLLSVLKTLELNEIHETLRTTFCDEIPHKSVFDTPPGDLMNYLINPKTDSNTILVLSTSDISVTCQKVAVHFERCRVHDFQQFFELAHELKGDTGILHVVIASNLDELKLSLRVRNKAHRLVIVALDEIVVGLRELIELHPVLDDVAQIDYSEVRNKNSPVPQK